MHSLVIPGTGLLTIQTTGTQAATPSPPPKVYNFGGATFTRPGSDWVPKKRKDRKRNQPAPQAPGSPSPAAPANPGLQITLNPAATNLPILQNLSPATLNLGLPTFKTSPGLGDPNMNSGSGSGSGSGLGSNYNESPSF